MPHPYPSNTINSVGSQEQGLLLPPEPLSPNPIRALSGTVQSSLSVINPSPSSLQSMTDWSWGLNTLAHLAFGGVVLRHAAISHIHLQVLPVTLGLITHPFLASFSALLPFSPPSPLCPSQINYLHLNPCLWVYFRGTSKKNKLTILYYINQAGLRV